MPSRSPTRFRTNQGRTQMVAIKTGRTETNLSHHSRFHVSAHFASPRLPTGIDYDNCPAY